MKIFDDMKNDLQEMLHTLEDIKQYEDDKLKWRLNEISVLLKWSIEKIDMMQNE